EEVAEAKQRIANNHDLYFTDVNAVGMRLTESVAAGDWRLLLTQRDAVAAVTTADVNRVATQYLRPGNHTLRRFIATSPADRPEGPVAPPAASEAAASPRRRPVHSGAHFGPAPGAFEARTRRITLGDGLKVALLPKRTRGGTVSVVAGFLFGDAESLAGRDAAADMAGAMLMRGTRELSRVEIDRRLAALQTKGGVQGGLTGANLSLLSRREHPPEALALMAQLLREPSFPEDEFEQLRLQQVTSLEAARTDPGSIASQAMALYFDPWPAGHPLHVDTIDESLERVRALKREDLV